MNSAQPIHIVLSNFRSNTRQDQVSIFHVVCTRMPKEQAICLLKECYKENSVVFALLLKHNLLPMIFLLYVQLDYKKQMTKVQLSIGIAVLFISFVTKSISLCISSIIFIVFIKSTDRTSNRTPSIDIK